MSTVPGSTCTRWPAWASHSTSPSVRTLKMKRTFLTTPPAPNDAPRVYRARAAALNSAMMSKRGKHEFSMAEQHRGPRCNPAPRACASAGAGSLREDRDERARGPRVLSFPGREAGRRGGRLHLAYQRGPHGSFRGVREE